MSEKRIFLSWKHGGRGAAKPETLEVRPGENSYDVFKLAVKDAEARSLHDGTQTCIELVSPSGQVLMKQEVPL